MTFLVYLFLIKSKKLFPALMSSILLIYIFNLYCRRLEIEILASDFSLILLSDFFHPQLFLILQEIWICVDQFFDVN